MITGKPMPLLASISLLALAGCSTVDSRRLDYRQPPGAMPGSTGNDASDGIGDGLTYFLPRQLVRISLTQVARDLDKAVDKLAKSRAAADAIHAALNDETGQVALLKAQIDATPTGTPGLDALVAALGKATGQLQITTAAAAAADADVASSNSAVILAAGATSPTPSLKIELLPPSADPAQRFVLKPLHSPFRDDTQSYGVSTDGLLSSANIVAVDHTADIITEIAGTAFGLSMGGGGVPAAAPSLRETSRSQPCTNEQKIEAERDWNYIFDPVSDGLKDINAKLACLNLRVTVSPGEALSGAATVPNNGRGKSAIYYRTAIPIILTVDKIVGSGGTERAVTLQSASLLLPQAGPVTRLPMRASPMVKTTNNIGFVNGMLVTWTNDRPSELLEVARTPFRIVERAFGAAGELVKLRVDYSSGRTALANGQAAFATAEAERRALLDCIATAKRDATDPAACVKD